MSAYSDRIIADGCSNYWRLGEAAGLTASDAVGGAHGTISGGVTLNQPGALADGTTAMGFNGTTGKVLTAASVTWANPGTLELWLRTTVTDGSPLLCCLNSAGSGDILLFRVTTAGTADFYIDFAGASPDQGATTSGPVIKDGLWHHVVYVLLPSSPFLQVFVDGTLTGMATSLTAALVGSSRPIALGHDPSFVGNFWSGALDEIAIYPRALTAPEIAAHYALRTAGASELPAPPLWWLTDDDGGPMIPYNDWRPITPSDTVNLDGSTGPNPGGGRPTCDALYVGGAGIVRAVRQDGGTVDFTVVAGQILPMAAIRVNATGTTATGLVALHQV